MTHLRFLFCILLLCLCINNFTSMSAVSASPVESDAALSKLPTSASTTRPATESTSSRPNDERFDWRKYIKCVRYRYADYSGYYE